jgi:hypothetical protein
MQLEAVNQAKLTTNLILNNFFILNEAE